MTEPKSRRGWLAASLLALAACSDGPSRVSQPDETPCCIVHAPVVQVVDLDPQEPLITKKYIFTARYGTYQEVRISYRQSGTPFFRLRLDKNSLLARPDGTPFKDGDFVTITITIPDTNQAVLDIEPHGLKFHPDHMPELRMDYSKAYGLTDTKIKALRIGRLVPDDGDDPAWILGPGGALPDSKEVQTQLPELTRFAILY
ncbi:MAG: hypothetical protein ACOY71_03590 [Gemmatimonadota bacterium]